MLLYFGNKLGRRKGNPTGIDYLGDELDKIFPMKRYSDAANPVVRALDMFFGMIRNARRTSVILIDVYSSLAFNYAFYLGYLSRLFGIPYILILRGGGLPKRLSNPSRSVIRFFDRAATLVAPSMYMFSNFEKFQNRVFIPNHILLENYAFKETGENRNRFLWVRSFHKIYNPKLAVQLIADLKSQGIECHLTMVGPDKDGTLDDIRQMIEEKGLQTHIQLTGFLKKPQIIELAKSCDLFINTTNIDNTPISLIEAMALGLPVISTNVGGIPYLIRDGETGLLFDPGDRERLNLLSQKLKNDPELSRKLAINARNDVEKFSWQNVKREWVDLIQPFFLN